MLDGPNDVAPPAPSPDEDDDAARARRMHERSGEVELLISGALVFGLFQIPGYIDGTIAGLMPRLGESQFIAVFMLGFYMRLIVVTLLVAFLLHLVTRAYWVGLIGLDSVFPDGIHWDRIKYGPLAKETYRERVPRLSAMARKADDFGSSIFSFAFWISVLFVWSIIFGGLTGAVFYLVKWAIFPTLSGTGFFVGVMGLTTLPTVAITIDKLFSARMKPGGRLARILRGVIGGAYWITGGPIFMPIQFTLFSRVPKKMIWPLFVGVFASLLFGFLGQEIWRSGSYRMSAHEVFPVRAGPRSIADRYFADTRPENSQAPYIQSHVVEGTWVVLRVPLIQGRLNSRLPAVCPDLEAAGSAGIVSGERDREDADTRYEETVLDCLGAIWTVTLDGQPLAPEWDFEWTTSFGPTGLVAYLPAGELRPGPHVLEVREIPTPRDGEDIGDAAERPATADAGEAPRGPRIDYIRFRR